MGMYDNLYVKRSIIDNLLPNNDDIVPFLLRSDDNQYYYFQTKSLERALWSYYLDEDGISVSKHEYNEDTETYHNTDKVLRSDISTVVEYYDYMGDAEGYNIFVTFCTVINNGQIVETYVESIKKTSVEEDNRIRDEHHARWLKIKSTPYWGLFELMCDVEEYFRSATLWWNKLKNWFRDKAQEL